MDTRHGVDPRDDKQKALNALVPALQHTRAGENVVRIDVIYNGEIAVIIFDNNAVKPVNIEADSAAAAIIDVCKALL